MTMQAKRRQMLMAGTAVTAGFLAGGWWWQHGKSAELSPAMASALWSFECPAMDGDTLALRSFRGQPLVINFWASWCPPCVAEMPLLDSFHRQNSSKGWHIVGLAIDQPKAVRQFLSQHPVTYPIGLANVQGSAMLRAFGNEGGGLPFTLVIDAQGHLLQSKLGKLTEEDLKNWQNQIA